jgi:hypothetical protein
MVGAIHDESITETDTGGAKNQPWELRIWSGMNFTSWCRLLVRNRFAVSPTRIPMAMALTAISVFGTCMWLLTTLFRGRRIARVQLVADPVFVLGHWRSGTTLLHELLAIDPRHTYPDTCACFAPNHFVFSAWFLSHCLGIFLPRQRPMDNMALSWEHPQEDEWAMCNMGLPSPYLTIAFPNRLPQDQEYLDLREVPPAAKERWKRAFLWFLKCLTARNPKRIVLKSPQHTCRIPVLLEMFPDARFVHIVRDPYIIFPSTIKTWKRMYKYHGLQTPRFEGLEEFVFNTFSHFYRVFEEDRKLIDPSRFCEVRYEDLVRDPVGQMRVVYDGLGLEGFEQARPAIEEYAAENDDYRPNRHELDTQTRDEITRRWSGYIQKYDYAVKAEDS